MRQKGSKLPLGLSGVRNPESSPDEDPRVRRTRMALVEAYVSLSEKASAEAFSVVDIASMAGVNRATFYRHFEDEADLRARGIPLALGELAKEFPVDVGSEGQSWERAAVGRVTRLFELLASRPDFFGTLLSGRAGPEARSQALGVLEGFLRENRLSSAAVRLRLSPSLGARALSSLLAGLASWSLEAAHRGELSPAELAASYVDIVARGLLIQ